MRTCKTPGHPKTKYIILKTGGGQIYKSQKDVSGFWEDVKVSGPQNHFLRLGGMGGFQHGGIVGSDSFSVDIVREKRLNGLVDQEEIEIGDEVENVAGSTQELFGIVLNFGILMTDAIRIVYYTLF